MFCCCLVAFDEACNGGGLLLLLYKFPSADEHLSMKQTIVRAALMDETVLCNHCLS